MTKHPPTPRRLLPTAAGLLFGLLLGLVAVGGCGDESPTADDEQTSSPSASPSAATPSPGTTATPGGLSVEQLSELPPAKSEVAPLMGMPDGLRSGPNDALSQVLEGLEVPDALDYSGYAYDHSTGNPNEGGEFASVGMLSMLGPEPEIRELYRLLTHEGLELSDVEQWQPVEVDGADEAAHVFVEVRRQGFVIDSTVARRGRLLLFLSVLSSEGGSRPEVGTRVAELALENAAELER